MHWFKQVYIRWIGVVFMVPVAILAVLLFQTPQRMAALAHGPLISEHEGISCQACHSKSPGSLRQQIQAKVHYQLGWRSNTVDFAFAPATSSECLACHQRPNDRHPIYRFQEPRFESALDKVQATSCLGCHLEHSGQMASTPSDFCAACHAELRVKNDPATPSHAALIKDNAWGTCLQCHDFHGNHLHRTPTDLTRAYDLDAIRAYLISGPSPYSDKKITKGRRE